MQKFILLMTLTTVAFSQLLLSKNEIEVPIGREVYLKPTDLQFYNVVLDEVCKVEVVGNEPISQRVGMLEPQVFDCSFKYGTVKYIHHGSTLLRRDTVKLRVYKFLKKDTLSEFFDLNFIIKNVTYNVVQLIHPLVVEEFFGLTDLINESIINFNFSRKEGAICKVRLSRYLSNRPAHGQVIIGREQRSVDVIKRRCDDFLLLGLRYKHLKPPSPNIDFILIIVEVSDPFLNNGELVSEWYHIPVEIRPGFPNLPPKAAFSGMYLMDVDQFIITTITPAVLSSTDSETPSEQLMYNISRPLLAHQGCLVHLSDHTRPIMSFRQIDLNNFDIAYKPPTKSFKERQMFEVGFTLYDSDFASSEPFTLHIAIRPAVTSAPRVSMNAGMVLLEGQSRPLRLSNLEIVDSDNIKDVQIFVTGGLHHGKLEVGKRPAVSFTQQDIEAGRVIYHHDDSDSTKDSVHLRIYDGSHSTHIKFPISIIPKDDNPPSLVVNVGLKVDEGENVMISPTVLRAVDHDTSDEHINFIVIQPPSAGTVRKKFAWEKDGNEIHQFTQRDVNKGLIYYHHNGNEVFVDTLELAVQDVSNPPNISPPYKISVQVSPIGDDPPKRDISSSFGIEVHETDVGVLNSKHLRFMDADSLDRELIYTITTQPRFIGSFAHTDPGKIVDVADHVILTKDPHLSSITNFTQEQVNHHKIAYVPPFDDIGPNALYLQFFFSVTDKHKNTVTGNVFNITILPVNNQIPQLHTGQLLVEEGSSTLLSTNELSVYDPDTLRTDLQMSLFTIPLHGSLRRSGQPLRVGDLLSLDDILTLRLEYVHDGSESFRDGFKVGVNDGLHFVAGEVLIEIEPVDDEIPVWQPKLLQRISVTEGESVRLTPQVLAASDVDTEDSLLFFILTKVPQVGNIIIDNRKVTRFTQRDVINGEVTYVHNSQEIGPNPREDSMTLIVTDKAFPRLTTHPSHKVFVTILPKNTRPPRISFKRAILVEEGHRTAVTEDNLSATDEDTFPSELFIVISKQPQYGYLENLRPAPGYEASGRGKKIDAFALQDVKNGFIVFVQSDHRNIEPESDGFEAFVTDGVHNSTSVLVFVSIVLQNDEEPFFSLSNITVDEGGSYILDNNTLFASDRDFPGDLLVIRISSRPLYGTLSHMVQAMNNGPVLEIPFTELAMENFNNIVYRHKGSENFADFFTLALSDGAHNILRTCHIEIIPINDEIPVIVKNIVAKNVEFHGTVLLSSGILLAEDLDNPPEELNFKVLASVNYGILQRKLNASDGEEWEKLEPLEFSQHDVNLNLVRYKHTSPVPTSYEDKFTFLVSDGVHQSTTSVFKFHLVDSGKTNLRVSVSGAVVEEGGEIVFNSSMLQASDSSSHIEDIAFHIIQQPKSGIIALVSNSSNSIPNFTIINLVNGQVLYKHGDSSRSSSDNFELMVTNGVIEKNVTFVITILPRDAIHYEVPVLEAVLPLSVEEDDVSSSVITSQHLLSYDSGNSAKEIIYIITQQPEFGFLLYDGKEIDLKSFTQEDLNKNFISYKSNKSGYSFTDQFIFKVSNGKGEGFLVDGNLQLGTTAFQISVKPKPMAKEPLLYIKSPINLETVWSNRLGFVLDSNHLKATFPGSIPLDLRFYVVKYLQHGYIFHTLNEKVVRTFTQDDIDKRYIVIILKQGIDTNDSFTFHVASGQVTYNKEYRMDIQWATVYFPHPEYSVCEDAGVLNIRIQRTGNLDVSSFVSITAISQTAKEALDYVPGRSSKVQFDPGLSLAIWKIIIVQDDIEEAPIEQVQVVLSDPENSVIGVHNQTLVSIYDKNRGSCSHLPSFGTVNHKVELGEISKSSVPSNENQEIDEDIDDNENENNDPAFNMVCSQNIYGLLHYNFSTGNLFQCNGKEWVLWRPLPHATTNVEEFHISSTTDVKTPDEPKKQSTNRDLHSGAQETVSVTNPDAQLPNLSCFEGWEIFDGVCHKWHRQQSTWSVAQKSCMNNNHSQLVLVKSMEHNNWLVEMARSKPFWIGLHASLHTNYWSYDELNKASFTNWKKGFPRLPSTGEVKHRCVLVRGSGHWINRHCEFHEHSFICAIPL